MTDLCSDPGSGPRQESVLLSGPGSAPAAEGSTRAPETLDGIVSIALQRQVAEIHIGVGERPRFREQGDLNPTEWPVTDAETYDNWLQQILSQDQIESLVRHQEYSGAHVFNGVLARMHLLHSQRGAWMKLRLITPRIPTFEQCSLPAALEDLTRRHRGLILVTGSSGSGKTTTLAAMIDHINRTMNRHILTLEDPITFIHQSDRSLIHQRDTQLHTHGFSNAMKASQRGDVDVILIDEILHRDTLSAAIEASQHGCLVFGTLQSTPGVRTVDRVLGFYTRDEHDRIRRAVMVSLLAEINLSLIPTAEGERHNVSVNLQAYRDYRPPHQAAIRPLPRVAATLRADQQAQAAAAAPIL